MRANSPRENFSFYNAKFFKFCVMKFFSRKFFTLSLQITV